MKLYVNGESVGIIVAAHKKYNSLERCLEGFISLVPTPSDLVFIDNGSREIISRWVAERFPGITILRLNENGLYCKGYNAGIREAMGKGYDFVLISNADTEVVNPEFLGELLTVSKRWPKGAFFGPRVSWRERRVIQKTCLQFPGITQSILEWLPWHLMRKQFQGQTEKETVVEFLNGVCVLCRVKALREIGLLDENMGGYVEDADWSWRAQRRGWVSVFAPIPSVVHYEEISGYEPYSLKTFLLKRNTVYWYLKIGKAASAKSYALASMILGMAKFLSACHVEERRKHQYFLRKLMRAYNGLLRREPLGKWFGPPFGSWEDRNEA